MIMFETKEQEVVVNSRVSDGYSFIGYSTNIDGIGGHNITLNKGRHTISINSLGYSATLSPFVELRGKDE